MTTKNEALKSTHIDTLSDGTIVLTRWADTRRAASDIADQFREIGADFCRVFENRGALGKFRIVGHIISDCVTKVTP